MPTIRVRRDNQDEEVELNDLDLPQLRRLLCEQSNNLVALKAKVDPYKRALSIGAEVPPAIRAASTAARYVGHNLQVIQHAITALKGSTCAQDKAADCALPNAFITVAKARLTEETFNSIMEDAAAICSN